MGCFLPIFLRQKYYNYAFMLKNSHCLPSKVNILQTGNRLRRKLKTQHTDNPHHRRTSRERVQNVRTGSSRSAEKPHRNRQRQQVPTVDGTGVRDYIHVVDLADGHLKALNYIAEHGGLHTWNLGTGNGYSVLQVLHAFEEACGKELPYKIVDRRPGDVAVSYADPSSALADLGWSASRDIKTMVRDHWNWQKNNPNGYEA